MKSFVPVVVAAVLITLTGCSSVGTPIAQDKVAQIRVGLSTESDVLLLFGTPSTKTLDTSGNVVLTWVYSSATTKLGGYSTQLQQLTVLINRKGRVENWTMNNSPGEVRYGRRS